MSTFSVVFRPPIKSGSKCPFVCFHPLVLTQVPEGVLVAKKDPNLPKHNEIDTKNLYVRSTVRDTFALV